MTPELAGLFDQASGMAPAVPVEFLNRLRDAVQAELARKNENIARLTEANDRLTEANQLLTEQLKSRIASQFGPKSENKASSASADASQDKEDRSEDKKSSGRPQKAAPTKPARCYEGKKPNPFPTELERVIVDIRPPDQECLCGGKFGGCGKPKITEILCRRPAQYFVLQERYHNLKCAGCGSFKNAVSPKRMVEGSRYDVSVVIDLVVSKFIDGLPFYRQQQRLRRMGVEIHRSTMAAMIRKYCESLEILGEELKAFVLAGRTIDVDETRIPILKPGLGRTATFWAWSYLRDDRRWNPGAPAAIVFDLTPTRSGQYPEKFLSGVADVTLMVDGYTGYNRLADPKRLEGPLKLARCNAHARRPFFEAGQVSPSPEMEEAVDWFQEVYAIEADLFGLCPDARLAVRQEKLLPKFEKMKIWCAGMAGCLQRKSKAGRAVAYFLDHYDGLTAFLYDGELELDNNVSENAMRQIAIIRKAALFAGCEDGGKAWMLFHSLFHTCHLNGVNSEAWLRWALERIAAGFPRSRYAELLPWHFKDEDGE